MTEAEWLACTEPKRMLAFRQGKALWRKRLLYHCACCRLIWPLLTNEGSRQAVAVCERYADGLAAEGEVEASKGAAAAVQRRAQEALTARGQALRDLLRRTGSVDWSEPAYRQYRLALVEELAAGAACSLFVEKPPHVQQSRRDYWTVERGVARAAHAWRITSWQSPAARLEATWWMRTARAEILRDMFGNPFRPGTHTAAWRTSTVVALAQAACDARDWAALPVLADALEDAGCTDTAILDHLRSPRPHARGCWVVDLVLGRK
ncbi:MAG TPA: hypothetical protein VEL76_24875 [Gemmataceae bacterium]|nr:hypothetical protein [Gemmataceae bacterium]